MTVSGNRLKASVQTGHTWSRCLRFRITGRSRGMPPAPGTGSAYIDSSRSDSSERSAPAQQPTPLRMRAQRGCFCEAPDRAARGRSCAATFIISIRGAGRFIMTEQLFLTDERKGRLGTRSWQLCEKKIEDWIARTLEASPKPWNIVVTHHPPCGSARSGHCFASAAGDVGAGDGRRTGRDLWATPGISICTCAREAIGGIVYVMGNSGNMKSAVYEKMDTLPDYCMALSGNGPNYQIIDAGRRKLGGRLLTHADGLIIDRFTIRISLWEVIAGIFR